MFNGYNESPLISHSDFHLEREKKQDNTSKWSYGQDPSQPVFSNRPSEFWCTKPNFIGIPNVANISPKCNCTGCYSSSESYQSDSTRVRSWLPKAFPVPINNSKESCKLPEHHQWNNVGVPNQNSCYSESNLPSSQYAQEGDGKHPYYRHFSNARFSEPNQPGVITTTKKSEFTKDLSKQKGDDEGLRQELTFQNQNGVRQSVFCNGAYSLTKVFDKRMECNSDFRNSNEKFSNVDSYRCPVNLPTSSVDQSRLSIVEPYVKTVPSDNNQNRVPSSEQRNIKEISEMYQGFDSRKIICSEPCSVFGLEKNSRAMYQSRLEKEGIEHFQHLHNAISPVESKNTDIMFNHRLYNMNRDMPPPPSRGNSLEAEGQKLLENSRSEFFSQNNYSEPINKINQSSMVDIRKDYVVNPIGQMNFSDLRYSDMTRTGVSEKPQGEIIYAKNYNAEKVYRQDKIDSTFCQKNDNLMQNKDLHNRMPPSSIIYNNRRDSCFGERTQSSLSCSSNLTDHRNYIRPEYSYQNCNSQNRYENPAVFNALQRNDFYHHRNSQQQLMSNFDRQFSSQSNPSLVFNPHFQQQSISSQQYHPNKNASCAAVQMNLPQNGPEDFVSRPSEMKNNYLETIRMEDLNKNKSNKISPLRLLRKKKFVSQVSEQPALLINTSDAAPMLDVRKFWSTWAEEEEESIGSTEMVVLDCQNIDPEQAKLLHFYESNPVRDVQDNSPAIRDLECAVSQVTAQAESCVQEVQEDSLPQSDGNKNTFENVFQKEEITEKTDLIDIKANKTENSFTTEKNNNENLVDHSLGNKPLGEKSGVNLNTSQKPSKRVRSQASQDAKEAAKNKKVSLDKNGDNLLDKWTEKKLGFLKRAEESKAAEILRHEEEKKKIFETRLSLQKGNEAAKVEKKASPKFNSDSQVICEENGNVEKCNEEKSGNSVPNKQSSFEENVFSQSPDCEAGSLSDLPTSEYRRNKFLDYSELKTMFSGVADNEKCNKDFDLSPKKDCQLNDKFSLSDPKESMGSECNNNNNLIKNDKHSLDFVIENGKEKDETDSKTDFGNINEDSLEAESKPEKLHKMKVFSQTKKISKSKKPKREESNESADKLTVENISTSKPTIKFSIQKSHDLKISFKVLNNKKYENIENEDKARKKESERQETNVENSRNSTECITLKLKSINRDSNHGKSRKLGKKLPSSRDLDLLKKCKRRMKRKRLREEAFKMKEAKNLNFKEEKDPLAVDDDDYKNCLKASKLVDDLNLSDNFQVQEKIDSAKIKLTFKRHKRSSEKSKEDELLTRKSTKQESKSEFGDFIDESHGHQEFKLEEKPEILFEPFMASVKAEPEDYDIVSNAVSKNIFKECDIKEATKENNFAEATPLQDIDFLNHENKSTDGTSSESERIVSPPVIYLNDSESVQEEKTFSEENSLNLDGCTEYNFKSVVNEKPASGYSPEEIGDDEEKSGASHEGNIEIKEDFLSFDKEKPSGPESSVKKAEEIAQITSGSELLAKPSDESFQLGQTEEKAFEITSENPDCNLVTRNEDNPLIEEEIIESNSDAGDNNNEMLLDCNENTSTKDKGVRTVEIEDKTVADIFNSEDKADDFDVENGIVNSYKTNEEFNFDGSQADCVETGDNVTTTTVKLSDDHVDSGIVSNNEKVSELSNTQNSSEEKETSLRSDEVGIDVSSVAETVMGVAKVNAAAENTSKELKQNKINNIKEAVVWPGCNVESVTVSESVENIIHSEEAVKLPVVSSEGDLRITLNSSPEYGESKLEQITADTPNLRLTRTDLMSEFCNEGLRVNTCSENSNTDLANNGIEKEYKGIDQIYELEDGELLSSPGSSAEEDFDERNEFKVNSKDKEKHEECSNISKEFMTATPTLLSEKYSKDYEKNEKSSSPDLGVGSREVNVSIAKENDSKSIWGANEILNSKKLNFPNIFSLSGTKFAKSTKINRRYSFEGDAFKVKKLCETKKSNLKEVSSQNAFTYSRWKSRFIKAQSCPPAISFVEKTDLPVFVSDISVEDIPLPPGDPPPGSCFDFKKYFKLQNAKAKQCSLETPTAKETGKEKSIDLPKAKSDEKILTEINNSQFEDSGLQCSQISSLSNKKDHQDCNEFLPESEERKKFKIKFSLTKPKTFKSIISESVSKNRLKNKAIDTKLTELDYKACKKSGSSRSANLKSLNEVVKIEKGDKQPTNCVVPKPINLKMSTEVDNTAAEINSTKSAISNVHPAKEETENICQSLVIASCSNISTENSEKSVQKLEENEKNSLKVESFEYVQNESIVMDFEEEEQEENTFNGEEFYKCEDIPTSEDLPNDIEVQKVSDDDKFRNIMQNCLDNAKKFLNVGNLKLFSCSVDDLLELDCQLPEPMTDESEPEKSVPANHVSRDVLLTSCEENTDDLGLSEKYQPKDMSMDFIPSFCSESSQNLCPEILPVENWPYLEEEVPLSPTKSKVEETDLTHLLENTETLKHKSLPVNSIRKTIKNVVWDKNNEMVFSDGKRFKRFRRRSFMSDGETYKTCSIVNSERRKTIDGSIECQKSFGRICGFRENLCDIASSQILQSLKCRLSLDKLNTDGSKSKTCSFTQNSGNTFFESMHSKLTDKSSKASFKSTEAYKRKKLYNYKSPVWQPKVVLFRISKQELRRIRQNSHSRSFNKMRGNADQSTEKNLESRKVIDNCKNKETNLMCSVVLDDNGCEKLPEKSLVSACDDKKEPSKSKTNHSVSDAKVATFTENLKESINGLSNPGSSSVLEIKKPKKRFRNLHSKEKHDVRVNWSAKDSSAQKNNTESEILRNIDLPKERDFKSKNKSTMAVTDVKYNEETYLKDGKERTNLMSTSFHKKHNTSSSDRSISTDTSDKKRIHNTETSKGSSHHSKSDKHRKRAHDVERESLSSKHRHRDRRKEDKTYHKHRNNFSEKESSKNIKKGSGIDGKKSSEKSVEDNSHTLNKRVSSERHESKVEELNSREESPECLWVCEVCGFSDATKRVPHIKSHPFHCQSCHLAFKTEARFVSHLTKKHKDIRNQHHCLLCELSFDTEDQYLKHLETREHRHLESVEKNTINTLFTLLTGEPCPVLGLVEMKPEWLPNQAGTVHFYHQATPLSLALQYLKMHHDLTSFPSVPTSNQSN